MRARLIAMFVLVAVSLVASACGGPAEVSQPAAAEFRDTDRGVSGTVPSGWYRAATDLTDVTLPRQVVALATFPLESTEPGGECPPRGPLRRVPPDGAFLFIHEYRPVVGDVWSDVSRAQFPPRPARVAIRAGGLTRGLACFPGRGLVLPFRDADRPLELFVFVGDEVGPARLDEIASIVDGLQFDALAPPPPDPYVGWSLLPLDSGDTIRVPPGWFSAGLGIPRLAPHPRTLFVVSNRRLPDVPASTPAAPALPQPFASATFDAFPDDGVAVWVVDEPKGPVADDFPAIDGRWSPTFRRVVDGPARSWPRLTWQRAGGAFDDWRTSVWVISGPSATAEQIATGMATARSLGLAGCGRDPAGCPPAQLEP